MTNEEIDAARKFLVSATDGHWQLTEFGREKALRIIDALCEAARQHYERHDFELLEDDNG